MWSTHGQKSIFPPKKILFVSFQFAETLAILEVRVCSEGYEKKYHLQIISAATCNKGKILSLDSFSSGPSIRIMNYGLMFPEEIIN